MELTVFVDKVVLISGSNQGIGKATAIELGRQGSKIVINGLDRKKLKTTKAELKKMGFEVLSVHADIRFPKQCDYLIRRVIAKFGKLDILINNAGISSRGSVEDLADPVFKMVMDTNYGGSVYLSKYAIPYLRQTQGHLIFINSVGGFRGMPYNVAYTASKMAQTALAQALRIELKEAGVHVGIVFVGFTENDPEKMILDVDGSWTYLPKRTNVHLAKPESVAIHIRQMIESRTSQITLTNLGQIANFMTRYFPALSDWILNKNKEKIKKEFTLVGGVRVTNLYHKKGS